MESSDKSYNPEKSYIELKEQEKTAYTRGLAKRNLHDVKGAIDDCSRAIEIDPKDAYAFYNRGKVRIITDTLIYLLKAEELGDRNASDLIRKYFS